MDEHKINPMQKIQAGHYRAFDENINDDNGDENKEKLFRYCCSTKCSQVETCSLVGCIKSKPL